MTVVGLHPEDLFDKLSNGSLSGAEAERLRSHLAECSVCRFELAVRGDFQTDLQKVPAPMPAPPPTPIPTPLPMPVERRLRGSRRRPAWVWGIPAAALFMATGALASVYTGVAPWKLFDERPAAAGATGPNPAEAQRAKSARPARRAVDAALPAEAVASSATVAAEAPAPAARAREMAPATVVAARGAEPRTAEPSSAALFAGANRARASGDSAGAIRLYRQLQQRFPRSSEAALSELTLATLLLHTGDARSALNSFDSYLGRGSRPLDAEALVGRALSLRALGQRDQEVVAWRSVIDRYPGSSYARRAAERLAALRKP
jgi:TolA-binding protein